MIQQNKVDYSFSLGSLIYLSVENTFVLNTESILDEAEMT